MNNDPGLRRALVRGHVLAAMRTEYPNPVPDSLIQGYLQTMGYLDVSPFNIREHFEYLAGKKYIEIVKKRRAFWSAKLTSDGIDLLDGNDPDEGVVVPL